MSYHTNSSTPTTSSGAGSTYGGGGATTTYSSSSFIKEKDGETAPLGFHFMDDGTLMSDVQHIREHGYDKKTINSFTIDAKDINHLGESKAFSIQGSGIFSLEISDSDGKYYNFNTRAWSTTKSGLYRVELLGTYRSSIYFPAIAFQDSTCDYNNDPTIAHDDDDGDIKVGMLVAGTGIPLGSTVATVSSDTSFELSASTTGGAVTNGTLTFSILKNFTINLFAETVENIQTSHAAYSEYAEADGSINVNKSTGSNSNLLKRIIYQDVVKNLYLSCIAPSLTTPSADTINQADGSANKIIIDGDATDKNVVRIGDKVTSGTDIPASVHALVTEINPDGDSTHEIKISVTDTISNNDAITFTPAFNGMTPNGVINTTGQQAFEVSSGGNLRSSFSITCTAQVGRTLSVSKIPTINDLCTFTTVTFGADPIVIPGENIGSSTHYGWPVTNIAGLQGGMLLDPARANGTSTDVSKGVNTTTPAEISSYSSAKPSLDLIKRRYYTDVNETTVSDVYVPGINLDGNIATAKNRNNIVTAQAGNLIFSKQQANALKADSGVRIFAYGAGQIKSLTGMGVAISDIVITPTQVSTTTAAAVSNSVTIPVTEAESISAGMAIRGIGINTSTAIPTVLLKSGTDGAKNLTASAAQTLEDGQTLFFDDASNILTITGTIEISNVAISDTTLYLDVERFLSVS